MLKGVLAARTREQLQEIVQDKTQPALVVAAAAAALGVIRRGNFVGVQAMLNRIFGREREHVEIDLTADITAMTREERDARIAELLEKRKLNEQNNPD